MADTTHDPEATTSHDEGSDGHGHGTKAIVAAFFANLGIAIAKFIGYAFTGASSMLAEAIHSLADTSNQGLLILGQRSARRGPSESHPFGYSRDRYFWAFVVSMVLFSAGGLFAIWEGFQKLFDPHEIENAWWAVGILLLGIVLEGSSFTTAVRESNKIRRGASWAEFIKHSKSPELPVVLLEDFGALIGLVLALLGISLAVITGNPVFDTLATIAIGVLLIVIAAVLAIEMRSLIIGEAATPADRLAMDAAILDSDDVLSIIHRRTQHLGPDHILLAAKVEFRHDMTVHELADAIDAAEARVRKQVPTATDIYIEPDVYRPPSHDAPRPEEEDTAGPED
jgi:cation diffusion facilitator family transporter